MSVNEVIFFEASDYILIGAQDDYSNGYVKASLLTGFIWKFCLYSTCKTDYTDVIELDECGPNQCSICPPDICLIDCPFDHFLNESDTCEQCVG